MKKKDGRQYQFNYIVRAAGKSIILVGTSLYGEHNLFSLVGIAITNFQNMVRNSPHLLIDSGDIVSMYTFTAIFSEIILG